MYTYNNRKQRAGRGWYLPRRGSGGRGRYDQQKPKASQGKSAARTRARFIDIARTSTRGGTRRRETNPLDEDGFPMTCNICGSIFHFSGRNGAGCPESYENLQIANDQGKKEEEANQCNVPIQHQEIFHMRSGEEALLDSCCSSNVMGKQWKDIFIDAMPDEDKASIRQSKGGTIFRFGGETPVQSTEKI